MCLSLQGSSYGGQLEISRNSDRHLAISWLKVFTPAHSSRFIPTTYNTPDLPPTDAPCYHLPHSTFEAPHSRTLRPRFRVQSHPYGSVFSILIVEFSIRF
jgi:hypothetical protein